MTGSLPGDTLTLFLGGDVMTGRGVDQLFQAPSDPRIYETYCKSALDYVRLAERANGPIKKPVPLSYIWGDALVELEQRNPDLRIINFETAVTTSAAPEPKGINYRMNPANIGVLTSAGIDCCVLANNHVLDWGRAGLVEGLTALEKNGILYAGAGRNDAAAAAPAVLPIGERRVLVFAFATPTSGVPLSWRAGAEQPGVNVVPHLSMQAADQIGEGIREVARANDIIVASMHWGPNWGWEIPREQVAFAHRLLEHGVHIVHGHSSHHVKGIEVHNGKLILYGCGDFIDDYEGISGYEEFRDDLVLMYFPTVSIGDGTLQSLAMVPLQIRNMRLCRASLADAQWLEATLKREGDPFGTHVRLGADNALRLEW